MCISLALPCLSSVCSLEQGSCFCLCSPNHRVLVTLCPSREQPRQRASGKTHGPCTHQCDQGTLICHMWKNTSIFRQLYSTHSECNSSSNTQLTCTQLHLSLSWFKRIWSRISPLMTTAANNMLVYPLFMTFCGKNRSWRYHFIFSANQNSTAFPQAQFFSELSITLL